jgi:hypothetical protein
VGEWRPRRHGRPLAENATYRYHTYYEPVTGREAIVESWFEDPDARGSFEASYEPYAVEGDRAVAVGTEWFMKRRTRPPA